MGNKIPERVINKVHVHVLSKINCRGVSSMLLTRSAIVYRSTTSLITRWKGKAISFRKPGVTGCLSVVARLLVKPIFQKIDWYHEKSKFKLSPFLFNEVWSFAKTIPLPISMAMLSLTTYLTRLIYVIFWRTLSSNSDGRKVFAPWSFLGSSLSSSFSTLSFIVLDNSSYPWLGFPCCRS